MQPARKRSRSARIPWSRKILYSLIPVAILAVSLECLLTALGVNPVTDRRDPYVGFSSQTPLFVRSPHRLAPPVASSVDGSSQAAGVVLQTAENKLVWFNPQSFPLAKSSNTKRVFCLGGSTTYGRPYFDLTSYVGWMREFLPITDPATNWEVINAGGVSYASYRVAAVMEELCQYEPDLFVVYTAHNEFLERRTYAGMFAQPSWFVHLQALMAKTRTFAFADRLLHREQQLPTQADILPAEVDERLNHTIGPSDYVRDPVWHDQVTEHYRANLQRMILLARDAGAEIVFIMPASNEKDCSPFKSELHGSLTPEQAQQCQEWLSRASSRNEDGDVAGVVELLQKVVATDPTCAEAQYRLGKSLWELGEFQAAKAALERSIEEDICPLRAVRSLQETLRQVAEQQSVGIIDFQGLLEQKCFEEQGHRCLGDEYFLDHVHPTIEVHRQLAIWIIDHLQRDGLLNGTPIANRGLDTQLKAAEQRIASQIDNQAHGVSLRNLAKVLHWSGKFEEAAPRARDALELLPNDPESRFVLADCLKNMGDIPGAVEQYETLFDAPEIYGRGLLPYGELLQEQQQFEQAKAYLLLAALRNPDDAYTQFLLGKVHLQLGEKQFAIECLSKADELFPNDPLTLQLLEQARAAD